MLAASLHGPVATIYNRDEVPAGSCLTALFLVLETMLYAQLATQRSATGPSQKRKPSAAERARAKVRALEAEIRKSRDLPASRNRDIKIQNQQRELAVLYNQLDPGRPQRIAAENARAEQDEVVKERTRISEIEKLIRRQEASG
ncbi:MAG TPA: hypothetical protein VK171_08535, partial [Fimbriimonas sp.]|nr:hypothetical protein [Fimbriimonas sp.]